MTVTTETTIGTLSAEDVKAIQKADGVVLRIYEGRATLEVDLDGGWSDSPRVFTAAEQRLFPQTDSPLGGRRRVIVVDSAISGYTTPDASLASYGPGASAFEMIHSAKYSDTWLTIAALIRVGDYVRLRFNADGHSNEITQKAGLHVDTASVEIVRPNKRPLVFHVATRVGYDNSARMIQARS